VDARIADERHQVLTLRGGYGICARPCPQCPWRPENDGVFPAEAFRLSARTAYDLADTTFGCHMTVDGRPLMCAGALLSTGAEHNLVIRMMLITGRFAWDLVSAAGARLHPDYRTMAQANGVASDDPTLTPCR
jgi:hypothetical protein